MRTSERSEPAYVRRTCPTRGGLDMCFLGMWDLVCSDARAGNSPLEPALTFASSGLLACPTALQSKRDATGASSLKGIGGCFMSRKELSEAKCEPAQPILRGVNLARLLTVEPSWCGCDCESCPPWLHPSGWCRARCLRMVVLPASNTGVHILGSAAASEAFDEGQCGPREPHE